MVIHDMKFSKNKNVFQIVSKLTPPFKRPQNDGLALTWKARLMMLVQGDD